MRSGLPGYDVRALAVRLVSAVLDRGRALDDEIAKAFAEAPWRDLEPRDKGLARLIAATVLRRKGELEAVLATFIERPLPDSRGQLTPILLCAAAQLLCLHSAPHAVINIAVEQCRHDSGAGRFAKLANAVLRRTSERGAALLATAGGARRNIADWQWQRWVAAYGEAIADRISSSCMDEAALDITAKAEPASWAERLGGTLLPTGTIRLTDHARIEDLPGFSEGAWWVQDAAAAMPARLLGDVAGKAVADLCAAPGGKTAQLAAAGAHVTAVDLSTERLERLAENLKRLGLSAETVQADIASWQPQRVFDAVLLDAPCTATGTIRRHPDILHLKRATDLARLVPLQSALLDRAFQLVAPGGILVYCTCSLEPEEGERQVSDFLARQPAARRQTIEAATVGAEAGWITPAGELRTMPFHMPASAPAAGRQMPGGMDGFFAARIERLG